jgi:hypothetical protein
MSASSLLARMFYAVVAIPAAGAVGFYASLVLLPKLMGQSWYRFAPLDEQQIFLAAIGIGALLAFPASLLALTMPWRRHRKRRGRVLRAILSAVLVLGVTLSFAQRGHAIGVDLALAVWLAYIITFTYVRYGVLDRARRKRDRGASDGPTRNAV